MRYFDTISQVELIKGIHDISRNTVVSLDESNCFFHPVPDGKAIDYDEKGIPKGLINAPPKNPEEIAIGEQGWVIGEMSIADIEVNKHLDGDARAIATEAEWRAYRCQLRDYVKGGQIVGERPVRPV